MLQKVWKKKYMWLTNLDPPSVKMCPIIGFFLPPPPHFKWTNAFLWAIFSREATLGSALSVRSFVRSFVCNASSSSVKIQASKSSIKVKRLSQASKSSIKIKRQNQASKSSVKIKHQKSSVIKSLKHCFAAILNKAFCNPPPLPKLLCGYLI